MSPGFRGRPLLPEITGSGGALVDIDGDGDLDAYLVQAGSLYESPSSQGGLGNHLFLNQGGAFVEAPSGHGANDTGYGMGVAAGDYDNDGDVDLYVTNVGPNALYRNDGTGHFVNVAATAGVDDAAWSTSAAFLDLDDDGDLDLFHTNYIHWSVEAEMNCYSGSVLTYCPPENYNAPARDRLYRNNGDGTFTDVSAASGIRRAFGNGFGVVGADFNQDGLTDLFIANDQMVDQLWLNRGGLKFDEVAALWGCAVDEHGMAKAGMGVAAADVDQDGDTDVLVTNITGQTDSFFRNEGMFFTDATGEIGLALTGRYTRWGVVLADFDNDGLLDLYEANGMVGTEALTKGLDFDEPNVLFRGSAVGRFEEVAPQGGVVPPLEHTSRGVAIGDVDDDGGLDLLVANRDGPGLPAHQPSRFAGQLAALSRGAWRSASRRLRGDRLGASRRQAGISGRSARRQLSVVERSSRSLWPRRRNSGSRRRGALGGFERRHGRVLRRLRGESNRRAATGQRRTDGRRTESGCPICTPLKVGVPICTQVSQFAPKSSSYGGGSGELKGLTRLGGQRRARAFNAGAPFPHRCASGGIDPPPAARTPLLRPLPK